ncbi:tumor necrosis factor receptor superfamily member 9 isoform X3 [Microtus pennsylvanicus]|uniref:tumor necrosis factor receptor superfamily member 9 isoform X3 n=1 Tax=Microtus pennsylvanicus TaxID=10058 RepID=UPI003F6D1DC5
MGNSCYNMVVTVLLVVGTERTRALQDSCAKCEAGTFCEKDNPVCTSCPPSTYSSTGGQPHCNICKVCAGYFRLKKPCSPTSNADCECIEGFHCLGPECAMCEKDCKPGQELTEQGCKNCGFGTFNDQNGGGTCRPWTNCSLGGKSVLKNGTTEKDVICGPALVSFSPGTSPTVTAPHLRWQFARLKRKMLVAADFQRKKKEEEAMSYEVTSQKAWGSSEGKEQHKDPTVLFSNTIPDNT